jgi:hypothetical protein
MARFGKAFAAVVALALVLGFALRSVALLTIGAGSDDFPQYAMLDGAYPVERSPLDLFNCWSGKTVEETQELMNFGTVPWWTHSGFHLAMMRPLSSALMLFDYRVFGFNTVAAHLHSLFWWVLLIAGTALVFREVLPVRMAAIAVALFAIEPGHNLPLLWLANRNALVSLSLAMLGLWAHIRWRAGLGRRWLVLSIAMFSLALLGGEWTFAVFAYLLAFEVFSGGRPIRIRARALLPAASLGLSFLVAQQLLGYSVLHSSLYVNPLSDPLTFLVRASERIPVFIADLVFGVPTLWFQTGNPIRYLAISSELFTPSVWRMLPGWQASHVAFGVLACIAGVFMVRWGLRERESRERGFLLFLLAGALLSLLPMVATFPSSRSVLPASIGASAIWAAVLLSGLRSLRRYAASVRLRRSLSALLVVSTVFVSQVAAAGVYSALEAFGYSYFYQSVRAWVFDADIDDTLVQEQEVFLVNTMEHTTAFFAPFVLHVHGRPMPRSVRVLSAAPRAHDIVRTAPNQLEFSVLGGTLLQSDLETLYRSDEFPFHRSDRVELRGLTVEIVELYEGKPLTVRFTFEHPLEDASYLFLYSSSDGLRRFPLPRVGEKVRLPKPRFPDRALVRPPSKPTASLQTSGGCRSPDDGTGVRLMTGCCRGSAPAGTLATERATEIVS